jgi:signal transduction histidine kinase
VRFAAPGDGAVRRVGLDLRRQLFLVFKEAVNNIARHADCTETSIEWRVDSSQFVLAVHDNGRGFDAAAAGRGHGLASMRRRIEALGGRFEVTSTPGAGTSVTATVTERTHRVARAGLRRA